VCPGEKKGETSSTDATQGKKHKEELQKRRQQMGWRGANRVIKEGRGGTPGKAKKCGEKTQKAQPA